MDPTVRRLTKKIFPYLLVRHRLMSSVPSSGIFQFSKMTIFSQGIGNTVIVYLHMYRPTLSNYLKKHVPSMLHSKINFWAHVAFLCIQARLTNDDVFDYFLTTCAITAEVALHCYMNGYDNVLSLASAFFCAFFENELYKGFHKSGGWKGLEQYIEDTSCNELYELVDGYIKELKTPSDHLPIFISIQFEQLAAARREKFMSLFLFKIGEIERKGQTYTLVSGIFHWNFMENYRISTGKSGILKRMENVRRKNNKSNISMDGRKHDESSEADEILDADRNMSNVVEPLCQPEEAQPSEYVCMMSDTRFSNKAIQTTDVSKRTKGRKESKNQPCTNNEKSEKTKFSSSSSLLQLRNFYESLSASSERKVDDSKYFRSNNGTCNGLKSSTVNELANGQEKINHFEGYSKSIPYSSENSGIFPKSKTFTRDTVIKSTEPFPVDDAPSEFKKSFHELGFRCLCVGNSSHLDEKSANFPNYTEVIEKCRYFQNKYSSIQFAILIPNNCFTSETSNALETEKDDEILSKYKYNEQKLSGIKKKDFNDCTLSPQKSHSEIEKTRFESAKVDKNQFRLAYGLALVQNNTTENIPKSRFVVTKVKENDLSSIGKTSNFSVRKAHENQMILKDETSLLGGGGESEPRTVSRFKVTKVNENQSKDGANVFGENWTNETTKISRFTVTKVNENQSKDGTSILGKNETTKISRFTVTKVNENESKNGANILRRNWMSETTKISRFTVRKVDENQFKSRAGMSLVRKSYPTNATKTSRFAVTRVGENQTSFTELNDSGSGEISSDTENETVHFQDNCSVKYQKRVSFAEHPFINYYQTYSSDDSSNSITSKVSLNKNSPKDVQSSRNLGHAANHDTLNPPTLRNSPVVERRKLFRWFSSSDSRSSSDKGGSSNVSSSSGFFNRFFRRSTSNNSKVDESQTGNKEEMGKQKIDELKKSEAEGIGNPVLFKI